MKYLTKFSIIVACTLIFFGYACAGDTETRTMSQQLCPVMFVGGMGCTAIKHDIYIDYNDERIYFCSKECMEKFKKNPETYLKRAEEKGVQFEKVPARGDKPSH